MPRRDEVLSRWNRRESVSIHAAGFGDDLPAQPIDARGRASRRVRLLDRLRLPWASRLGLRRGLVGRELGACRVGRFRAARSGIVRGRIVRPFCGSGARASFGRWCGFGQIEGRRGRRRRRFRVRRQRMLDEQTIDRNDEDEAQEPSRYRDLPEREPAESRPRSGRSRGGFRFGILVGLGLVVRHAQSSSRGSVSRQEKLLCVPDRIHGQLERSDIGGACCAPGGLVADEPCCAHLL